MSGSLDMNQQVAVNFELATLLHFQEMIGSAGFHDPILDHLSERPRQVHWKCSDTLRAAHREAGVKDWASASAEAEQHWDRNAK